MKMISTMYVLNGHKTSIHEANVKRRKRKVHKNLTTSLKIYKHSP